MPTGTAFYSSWAGETENPNLGHGNYWALTVTSGTDGGPTQALRTTLVDNFVVVWKSNLVVQTTGTYTFYGGADDFCMQLLTDPTKVISSGQQFPVDMNNGALTPSSFTLVAGVPYTWEQRFIENGGGASGNAGWNPLGAGNQIIPSSNLCNRVVW